MKLDYTGVKLDYIGTLSAIASFCGLIYMAYTAKKLSSTAFLMEKIEEVMDEIHSNKQLQAKMYDIGAFMGSAIAHGTGLKGSKKGGILETIGGLYGMYKDFTQKPQGQQEAGASFGQTS